MKINKKIQTQLVIVRKHLLSGNPITCLQMIKEHSILNLRALIAILRHKEGIPIEMTRVQGKGHTWWGEYQILPENLHKAKQAVSDK